MFLSLQSNQKKTEYLLSKRKMYRTNTCGELTIKDINKEVMLSGWVQRIRDKGGIIWIDLRDRYGITQLVFDEAVTSTKLIAEARKLGREYVVQIQGVVLERLSKNPNIPTGEIEIRVSEIIILNASETPPFTIEDESDGGDELRMKYRYLDLRRNPVKEGLMLRHKMASEVRKYMDFQGFIEVETPVLIKSTPEGARDFVVPSRIHPGEFYALPQSPQTFKQLLMISGLDKYFQIVKCFRDEDLRADRQPEFTQIDCEMSFVERDDIINTFEGLAKHLFKNILNVEFTEAFPRITWHDAMEKYGSDKPDIRFEMYFNNITEIVKGAGFPVFDDAEYIVGICVPACAEYSRKQLDELTNFVRRPQIGAKGLVYVKCNDDGTYKSSVDKFYSPEELAKWAEKMQANRGDLLLVLAGDKSQTLSALCELRLEMGRLLGLRDNKNFKPLWVVDFPLLEWDEESKRFYAMHHPFTSPLEEDKIHFKGDMKKIRANAYDFVINGVEIGGGSIRIHDETMQKKMFEALGFTEEEAKKQFGFLLNAFKYGAPPHGGIAFGFDRWVALFAGMDTIRDIIAFPKNNSGKDVMIDSPACISAEQLKELGIEITE